MLNTQLLPMFGSTAEGLEFDYVSPARADREGDNAERTSKAEAVKTYIDAGFEPKSVLKAMDAPDMDVGERPAPVPVVPSPVPGVRPGDVDEDTGQDGVDNLLRHLLGDHHHPHSPVRAAAESLAPDELPDVAPMLEALDAALAQLMAAGGPWEDVTAEQRRQLVAEVRRIIESGEVEELAELRVDSSTAQDVLYAAMLALAVVAAGQLVAEAAEQGVTISAVTPPAVLLAAAATVVTTSLAAELTVSAMRAAMAANGPGVTAEQVAEAVRQYLGELSDAGARRQLGGALHGTMNAARVETLRAAPEASIYATERNDSNTCGPCKEVDGRFLGTTSQMDQIEKSYPAGAYGGYVYCLGGPNCRGTITGVWRPKRAG
jgi:hypothetical protein